MHKPMKAVAPHSMSTLLPQARRDARLVLCFSSSSSSSLEAAASERATVREMAGVGQGSEEGKGRGPDAKVEEDSVSSKKVKSEEFDSEPPAALEESDWCGEERSTELRCHHGYIPKKKVYWEEDGRTGRRLLGCPLEEDDDQCNFVKWIDGELGA
ncbi:hypothetical protein ACP70R_032728 [Stipagrostis hirtigluma subsp. patula]